MGYEPILDAVSHSNVYGEHVFKLRVTFGATSAITSYRSKDATIAASTTGTWVITLPKYYAEVTSFHCGWAKASGAAPLQMQITTDAVTSGTLTIKALDTNSAGTATDPVSGDVAYIEVGVSCDTQNDNYTG